MQLKPNFDHNYLFKSVSALYLKKTFCKTNQRFHEYLWIVSSTLSTNFDYGKESTEPQNFLGRRINDKERNWTIDVLFERYRLPNENSKICLIIFSLSYEFPHVESVGWKLRKDQINDWHEWFILEPNWKKLSVTMKKSVKNDWEVIWC